MTAESASATVDDPTGDLSPVDGLAQLAFLVHGALEHRAGEAGVSLTQARLLGILRDREPTMNELGLLLGLDKSSVSGLVDRAERRGLVERIPSATDRRSVRVRTTDAGRVLTTRIEKRFEGDVMALLARIPARERTSLSAAVGALLVAEARERGIAGLIGPWPPAS